MRLARKGISNLLSVGYSNGDINESNAGSDSEDIGIMTGFYMGLTEE